MEKWKTIFLILLIFQNSHQKKRKETNIKLNIKVDPLSKKPDQLPSELFCAGCIAYAVETVKKLQGSRKKIDIISATYKLCDNEYKSYCNKLIT